MFWNFMPYMPYFNQFCYQQTPPSVKIEEQSQKVDLQKNHHFQKEEDKNQFKLYLIQELSQKRQNNKRKIWSEEEDQLLLQLAQTQDDWDNIAAKIGDANKANCIRRYQRLMKEEALWSRQIDQEIVRLREQEGKQWPQIRKILRQTTHSASQIRERYENQLRKGINREKWSIQEDLLLLQLVKKHKTKWGLICQNLSGRTERQVKNRYCRTLEPVLKKLDKLAIKEYRREGENQNN